MVYYKNEGAKYIIKNQYCDKTYKGHTNYITLLIKSGADHGGIYGAAQRGEID